MSGELDTTGVGPGNADIDEDREDEGEDEELDLEALAARALEAGLKAREHAQEVDGILSTLDSHAKSLGQLEGTYPDLLGGGGYHTTAREDFERAMKEHEERRDCLLDRLETIAPTEAMARRMLRIAEEDGAMALAKYIGERLVPKGILHEVELGVLRELERRLPRKFFVRIPVGTKPRPVYVVPEGDNTAMYLGAMARRGFRSFFDRIDAEEAEAKRILKTPIDLDSVDLSRLFDPSDWQYRHPYVDALPEDRFQSGIFGFGVSVRGLQIHNPRKRRDTRGDREQKTSGVLLGAVVPAGFKGRDGKQVVGKALEVYRVVGDLRWVVPQFRRYVLPDSRGNYPADRLPPPPAAQAHLVPKLQFASIAVLKLIKRIQEQAEYDNGRLLLRGRGEHGVLTEIEERRAQRVGRRRAVVEQQAVPEWWKNRRDVLKRHPFPKDPALPQVVGRGLSDQIEQAVDFAIYVDRLPLTRGKDEVTWSGVVHMSVAPTTRDAMAAKLYTIVELHGAVEGDEPGTPVPVLAKGANLTVQLTAEAPPLTYGRNVCTKPIHAVLFHLQRKFGEWQAAVSAHEASGGSLPKTPKLSDFLGVKAFLTAYPEESVRINSATTSGATVPTQATKGTNGAAATTSATDAVAAPAEAQPADTSAGNG